MWKIKFLIADIGNCVRELTGERKFVTFDANEKPNVEGDLPDSLKPRFCCQPPIKVKLYFSTTDFGKIAQFVDDIRSTKMTENQTDRTFSVPDPHVRILDESKNHYLLEQIETLRIQPPPQQPQSQPQQPQSQPQQPQSQPQQPQQPQPQSQLQPLKPLLQPLQTTTHTKTHTQHTNTQTHKHTNTQTHKHTNTQTHTNDKQNKQITLSMHV